MNFEYRFLVVGSNDEFCSQVQTLLNEDFPQSHVQCALDPQDGVDYCQANVFDLIIADSEINSGEPEAMITMIRQLENDNLTTGVVMVGESKTRFQNFSHVMFSQAPITREEYFPLAKTLLTLKY